MQYTITTSSSAAVIDSLGAQLISLQDVLGNEYVWQRDPAYWAKCAPILFPMVGRLENGKIRIEGQNYEMPIHGFAKESEFELYEQGKSTICFVLKNSEDTLKMYPYKFELYVRFTLQGDSLITEYNVRNINERPMLFCIGAHPGFYCPLQGDEKFEDYELRFERPETISCPTLVDGEIKFSRSKELLSGEDVLPLTYDLFDDDALVFEKLSSRRITLISRKSRRGLEFHFPDYDTVAFWTPPKRQAPFLCFEPWHGMGMRDDEDSTSLQEKKGVITLQKKEEFTARFTVAFI